MKNACGVMAVAVAIAVGSGCVSQNSAISAHSVSKPLGTTATYDVLGDAQGSATGGVLFGFIPVGMERRNGRLGIIPERRRLDSKQLAFEIIVWPYGLYELCKRSSESSVGPIDPVESVALYNAIESVPTADMLLMPRYRIERSNYIVYSEKTVTVKGKAIRLNDSAK